MKDMQPQELKSLYGENVRRRRQELGLTQEVLAERLNVSQPYIAAIERGQSWPRVAVFAKIAEGLQTSPATLLSPDSFVAVISG